MDLFAKFRKSIFCKKSAKKKVISQLSSNTIGNSQSSKTIGNSQLNREYVAKDYEISQMNRHFNLSRSEDDFSQSDECFFQTDDLSQLDRNYILSRTSSDITNMSYVSSQNSQSFEEHLIPRKLSF